MTIRFLDEPSTEQPRKSRIRFLDDQKFSETPLARSFGKTAREFNILGSFSPRFQREIIPVEPRFAAFNVATNVATQAQEDPSLRKLGQAAVRALPFGRAVKTLKEGGDITQLESLTEPIELTPPRKLITNVARAIDPEFKEPESLPAQIGLDIAGGLLTASPQIAAEGVARSLGNASRRVDLSRATQALKNQPERLARLRKRQFGELEPQVEARQMPAQLEFDPLAIPESRRGVITTPEVRKRFGERVMRQIEEAPKQITQERGGVRITEQDETRKLLKAFRGLGKGGQARISKSFEGMTEKELKQEISKLKGQKFPDKATIRVEKFGQKERPIVEGIQETFDISKKTRGRLSIPEINARAKSGKITVDELRNLPEGTALPAEELQRARGLTQEAVATSSDAVSRFLKNPSDEQAFADAVASTKTAVDTLTSTRAAMAEAGRSLRILRESVINKVRLPSEAKQLLDNVDKEKFIKFATQYREAIEKGQQELAVDLLKKAQKSTWFDKAVNFGNALLLTNPQTDVANTVGNTLGNLVTTAERAPIAFVDKIRSLLTKTPRERFLGEAKQEAFSTIEGLKEGASDFIDVMLGKSQETGKIAEIQASRIGKSGIDKISDFIFRRLGAEDVLFKGIKKRQSLNAQAFRIAKKEGLKGEEFAARIKELRENPTGEMLEEASQRALESTFQESLGGFTKKLNQLRQYAPVRIIFPFFRTLVNLAKFPARRTPLALTPGTRSFGQIIGREGAAAQSEAIGRMILGTTASIPLATMAAQGLITGSGPSNKNQKRALQAQGWQPFSIRTGDKYISYRRAEPLSTMMATIATLVERSMEDGEEQKEEKIFKAISDSAGFVSDQTFWRGMRELIDFARGRNKRFLTNLISGRVTPPGLSFVSRAIDPEYKDPEGLMETLKSRIPGVSKSVQPKLDIFGKPIRTEGGILNRITPFRATTFKPDLAAQELFKFRIGISEQGKTTRGVPLNREERFNITQLGGQTAKQALDLVVNSDGYQNLPDSEKEKLLRSIIRKARSGASETELIKIAERELNA